MRSYDNSKTDDGTASPPANPTTTPVRAGDGEAGAPTPSAAESATGVATTGAVPSSPCPHKICKFDHDAEDCGWCPECSPGVPEWTT